VGLTIMYSESSCFCLDSNFPLALGSLIIGGVSGPTYTCAGRGSYPLITHFSIGASMEAWNGLVEVRGLDFVSE